jgi:hypothetical protein
MKNIKKISIGDLINFVCFVISIALAVIGFILPPTGEIDNSVLICIGELGFFSTVSRIPELIRALKNGASVDLSFGDKQIHIEGAEEDETK